MINVYRVDEMKYASLREQQEFVLFAIAVAGRNALRTAQALDRFINLLDQSVLPFEAINGLSDDALAGKLMQARLSPYRSRSKSFREVSGTLTLRVISNVSVDEFEGIYGIGPKTARFIKMNTVEGARVAALDVHILQWMRDIGHNVAAKQTPSNPRVYANIEEAFVAEADQRGMTPGELDLKIWTLYSAGEKNIDNPLGD